VEYDSRRVGANTLVVAIEGFESDGHRFIHDAISRGAVAVVVSSRRRAEFAGIVEQGITLIDAENSRRALSQLSAAFFR
jgi:UDP-N-acetylmuramoyl-L-alanyl-D-glutamate--2,6-diaminopimelate ligase